MQFYKFEKKTDSINLWKSLNQDYSFTVRVALRNSLKNLMCLSRSIDN